MIVSRGRALRMIHYTLASLSSYPPCARSGGLGVALSAARSTFSSSDVIRDLSMRLFRGNAATYLLSTPVEIIKASRRISIRAY